MSRHPCLATSAGRIGGKDAVTFAEPRRRVGRRCYAIHACPWLLCDRLPFSASVALSGIVRGANGDMIAAGIRR